MDCTLLAPLDEIGPASCASIAEACRHLDRSGWRYEAICVLGSSARAGVEHLRAIAKERPQIRFLAIEPPTGLSAALSAGIAAARGETIVAWAPTGEYRPAQIPAIVERLSRADFVGGRREACRRRRLAMAALQIPRRALLGLEVRDPDCLFWAARREAVAGLELAPGMHRFLASLCATRGFRVAEFHVEAAPLIEPIWRSEARPNLGNLLSAWWERRRFRTYRAIEMPLADETAPRTKAA